MGQLRKLAKAIFPGRGLRYWVSSQHRERYAWERDRAMGKVAYGCTGGRVAGGPFKGLQYVDSAIGSTLGPKLLGTYEKELNGIVERIVARAYGTVVNIGAGEGYYAVGLATRMRGARVICFEAFEKNREQLANLATLNGVADRLDIRSVCTAASLGEALADLRDVLVLCDVEGSEIEILDPSHVPALRSADLLVETHDAIRSGVSSELTRRFEKSHQIDVVWTQQRTLRDWPAGIELPMSERLAVLAESRGVPMSWFWMTAR